MAAAFFDDLYAFDLAAKEWTQLSADDDARKPSPRRGHGIASVGGRLYVHGGETVGPVVNVIGLKAEGQENPTGGDY